MSRETQVETVKDIADEGRKVTLRTPRGGAEFLTGAAGAASGLSDVQTHMLQKDYAAWQVGGQVQPSDVKFIVASGSIPASHGVPGPGWEAYLNPDGVDGAFPVPGAAGVTRYRVVRLEKTVQEGAFAILFYLQVRS